MSSQPLKVNYDYDAFLSNEMRNILSIAVKDILKELPSDKITTLLFLISTIGTQDSMMYKVMNGYLTTVTIEEIYDSLYALAKEKIGPSVNVLEAGKFTEYSQDLKMILSAANRERIEMGCKLITSDHVLLAILRERDYKWILEIGKIFTDKMVTYDIIKDYSMKMHDITDIIAKNVSDENSGFGQLIEFNGRGKIVDFVNDFPIDSILGNDNNLPSVKKRTKLSFCTCISSNNYASKTDTLIGREEEIAKIIKTFERKKCKNVILIGESGVGKTAIVEGLAKMIAQDRAPKVIRDCDIFSLDLHEVYAGTQFRGSFEEKVSQLAKELKDYKNAILFIDDIHIILGDKNKSIVEINQLFELFSNDSTRVIVTTTPKGYHYSIEGDGNFNRIFQKIVVEPPTDEECLNIINGLRPSYEKYHGVKYDDDVIKYCVSLSKRYITDKNMPTSAIDILDEAGAKKKIELSESKNMLIKKERIQSLNAEKEAAIKADDWDKVKNIDYQIDGIRVELSQDESSLKKLSRNVTIDDICNAVSEKTGIPTSRLSSSEKKIVSGMDEALKKCIIGQDDAIDRICRGIKRGKVGLSNPNKPILSALCIGKTGCGKTLMAKKIAKEVFGDEKKYLIRLDMSEYSDQTSVNKLIGASAGYVGYGEGGILTEAVKNKKHAVILIDEIEKAHPLIYNLFLQILDEGFIADNTGKKVDFRNTIILMTSNIGAKRAANERGIGFSVNENENSRAIIEKELKNHFPPEFINRVDEIVFFNNLTSDNLKKIIELELNNLKAKVEGLEHEIYWDDSVVEYILKLAEKDKEYGARPILRIIQNNIESKLTDMLLNNDDGHFKFRMICFEDDKLQITIA